MYENPFIIILNAIMENNKILYQIIELQQKFLVEDETYLSPEETRKMFRPVISKSTLLRWTKKGYIKSYIMGGRRCYKLSEIEEAIKTYKS